MKIVAIIMLALFAVEMFLLACFISAYYRTGIVLFKERLLANAKARDRLTLHTLDGERLGLHRRPLALQSLDETRMGFHITPLFPLGNYHSLFLMRGRVDVDARRGEVRIVGMCSWTEPALLVAMLILFEVKYLLIALPLFILMYFVAYWIQRKAFQNVVNAVRWQLMDRDTLDLTRRVDALRTDLRPDSTKEDACHS
ncbi:hypothetical protein [Stenotrophomonas sp. PS02289]|uniref:hypothetical protein n=1 Tax=Stenotrophomonas sp. PS02289 TaxID=2991422 RepID=UPI00249A9233|nr:hypothetical protein [Stenotrophomonas sp. PS02289]